MAMNVKRVIIENIEENWASWEDRSRISHAPNFASARNTTVAFNKLDKPMSNLRIALASSGGVYYKSQDPFDLASHAGDDSVRWIPGDANTDDLRFAHDHYDHTAADLDPNCMFPLDRLREMASEGIIGSVASLHVGFMGFIPDPTRLINEIAPSVASRLQEDQVDAMIISPG